MEEREMPRMLKYEESKMTQIMMATVRHVTSSSELRKFQTDGFFFFFLYKLRKRINGVMFGHLTSITRRHLGCHQISLKTSTTWC
jgi:hypothetical protein